MILENADWLQLLYGHGIATTILQLAKGYSVLSNGGYEIKPTLIYKENNLNKKNKRILNKGSFRTSCKRFKKNCKY